MKSTRDYTTTDSTLKASVSDSMEPCDLFLPTNRNNLRNLPVWIDTDVGFDDLVAIACCSDDNNIGKCISNGNESLLAGISTVGGGLISDPFDGVSILRGLIPGALEERDAMPIVAGLSERSKRMAKKNSNQQSIEDPPWLEKCREQMNEFCASEGIHLMPGTKYNETSTGTKATAINHMLSHEKLDLVCLGPLTNLAHWLEERPDFATNHLNSIWILGGNIPIRHFSPTSSEKEEKEDVQAEFNFARDPEAVRAVFSHTGLKNITIFVVPQEVCDRKAFEQSFGETSNAGTIIENWLQSSLPLSLESKTGVRPQSRGNAGDGGAFVATSTIQSLLSAWMVRLIRKRTFSVYGDPICLYTRHHTYGMSSDSDWRPQILWKDYKCASNANTNNFGEEEVLSVDGKGRLVLSAESAIRKLSSPSTFLGSRGGTKHQSVITVRIAHQVELGPKYMEWLATSLVSSGTTRKK